MTSHIIVIALLLPGLLGAQKFFPDDPLDREPPPFNVTQANSRKLGDYYDFFRSTFTKPGERHSPERPIPGQNVNTLGEVMDGPWYVNRHYRNRMTIAELQRGPGDECPPSPEKPWKIIRAKTEGVTPGFDIQDSRGRKYVLKFDPLANLELASAAERVCSRFFHALGYHVPEAYVVYFDRDQLEVAPGTSVKKAGVSRPLKERDVDEALFGVPKDPVRGYRAVASRYIEGGLGPFRYDGTRSDDPNDIVPHEHHRELRGLFVFAAWLGHNDIKCLNTLDTLVEEGGVHFIRHYLIDFGASLGSDSFTVKSPRAGYDHLFRWRPMLAQMFSLGFYLPEWARADYPHYRSVGNFEYEIFEPEEWKPNYPAPIFDNRLPDDTFWAARQVMWFTDEEIRAIVETGQYSDPEAVDWLVKCLIERRNKIGRTYFARVLPLDRFRISDGRLEFEDLGVAYGFVPSRRVSIRWSRFDNPAETHQTIAGAAGPALPAEVASAAEDSYFAATLTGEDETKTVTVYLRKKGPFPAIVGVDRTW